MPDDAASVAALLHRDVERVGAAPVGFSGKSLSVDFADGTRAVLERFADAAAGRRNVRGFRAVAVALGSAGVSGLVAPAVLADDLDGPRPWALVERLPGTPGVVDSGAASLATRMGEVLVRLRDVTVGGIDLPRWTDPTELVAAARRTLTGIDEVLRPGDLHTLATLLAEAPDLLSGRPAVLSHGNFGPRSVLMDNGRVTGIIDLEHARIADPHLDVAWWAWVVRFHSPDAFHSSWPTFVGAAGVDPEEDSFTERLRVLLVLRLLERVGESLAEPVVAQRAWIERLTHTLTWHADDLALREPGPGWGEPA